MMDVLKGAGGSVRSLSLHPEEPLIASVGLDRWLRVHHTGTKKQLAKVYLKQQLTGVTWCPSPPPVVAPGEAAREEPETEAKETKRGKSKSKSKSESGKSKKRKQR
jgi:ribosome biogenesis protein NSA1